MMRLLLLFLITVQTWAASPFFRGKPFPRLPVDRGYEALKIYNYFRAREIFLKPSSHWPVLHAHGLAVIYFRTDNPFSDPDKAHQQARLAISGMYLADKRELRRLKFYSIDVDSLVRLRSAIEARLFPIKTKNKSFEEYESFLKNYPESWLKDSVIVLRNHAAFLLAGEQNTPEAFLDFTKRYRGAADSSEAYAAYERRLFETLTAGGKLEDYEKFLMTHPSNPFAGLAEDSIFSISMRSLDPASIYQYIQKYPSTRFSSEAWKKLFFLEIKDLSAESLSRFLSVYPDYPERERLKEEIELSATRLWIVKESGKYGFIDVYGKWVIRPEFDHLEPFSEGYAAASREGRSGFINRKGQDALSFTFLEVNPFLKGFASAKNEDGWGLLDHSGSWVIKPRFDEMEYYGDSLILVGEGDAYFFVNLRGQAIWPKRYQQLSWFMEGLCLAEDSSKYGFLRPDGSVAIPFSFDWAEPFSGGRARVQSGDFFGIIDLNGNIILPTDYDFVGPFENGLAVVIKDGKAGFIDDSGKMAIPLQYDASPEMQTGKVFYGDLARIRLKGKAGIIDRSGLFVIPARYSEVQMNRPGPAAVKKGSTWYILDKSMKMLPIKKVDYISAFQSGKARVRKKELWGLMDERGKWLLKPDYEEMEPLLDGFLRVKKSSLYGILRLNGEIILPAAYDRIQIFSNDMLQLEKNGRQAIFIPEQKQYLWKEKDF
jgi:hypothetical protein